ncbi:MAG: spheroidene monooxygenase [Ferruginibacter sp.]|nr:spheroidene monooxygenase [Ferruginibacter sp.]
MQVTLTIIRYPKRFILFAVLAMAVHRFPFWFNKQISFFKLMGCGKNGSFDKHPDWQQWGIFAVSNEATGIAGATDKDVIKLLYGPFISNWLRFFNCETWTIFLEPIEGRGCWDGKQPFGPFAKNTSYNGLVAVLTRATIRLSKLPAFWRNVNGVASQMAGADGFITSIGIGEMPLIKQATFSIWQSRDAMKQFAYQMHQHTEVIRKTRKENWYSEDMFVRFKPVKTVGTINGTDPLMGKI